MPTPMKNLLLLILLTTITANLSAQYNRDRDDIYRNISIDILGDLQYYNSNGSKASLKKNIFDDVIYNDSRNNESKYTKEQWAELLEKFNGDKKDCFAWLIRLNKGYENQKTEHSKNIFGDEIRKDNRGNSETYKRDILGNLVYENNKNQKATFTKEISDRWKYEDSKNNRKSYSYSEWEKLIEKYHSEEAIFKLLVNQYLLSDL